MNDHAMYRDRVLEHYRNPDNYGELENADIRGELSNPSCGDRITFFANTEAGKISRTQFTGKGCAICQAAASLLTEEAKGKSLEAVEELEFSDMEQLLGVEIEKSRKQCATLALEALQEGIDDYSGS